MTVQERVLDAIRRMSVADLVDLVRAIAAEPEVRQVGKPTATDEAGTDQGGVPTISLRDWESNKLEIIKAVREVTDLGLGEARQLLDGATGHDTESDDGTVPAGVPAVPKRPCRQVNPLPRRIRTRIELTTRIRRNGRRSDVSCLLGRSRIRHV